MLGASRRIANKMDFVMTEELGHELRVTRAQALSENT